MDWSEPENYFKTARSAGENVNRWMTPAKREGSLSFEMPATTKNEPMRILTRRYNFELGGGASPRVVTALRTWGFIAT